MKVKLVKVTDNIGVYYVLNGSNLPENYVLSDKNCQAIERGYDLDELRNKAYKKYDKEDLSLNEQIQRSGGFLVGYEEGFQKALELMGNKKFSEEDVVNIAEYVRVASQSTPKVRTRDLFDEYQSLQQTEWDVEIEMEDVYDGLDEMAQPQYYKQPKLDAYGNLILKRI